MTIRIDATASATGSWGSVPVLVVSVTSILVDGAVLSQMAQMQRNRRDPNSLLARFASFVSLIGT